MYISKQFLSTPSFLPILIFCCQCFPFLIGSIRSFWSATLHFHATGAIQSVPVRLILILQNFPVTFHQNSLVFIQIYCRNLREIQISLVIPFNQLIISSDWRRSCCQSQYTVWFHDHLCRDDIRCFPAHVLVIFCTNDLHTNNLPVFYGPRSAAVLQLLSVYHRTAGSTIPAKRQRTKQEPPGPGTNTRPRRPQECFLAESTSFSAKMFVTSAVRYSIFFSSSYTNCTLVPMTTWQVVLSGRMTPAAPAAFTAFSSTWV